MSFQEFDEIEEMQPNKRNKWWWLLKPYLPLEG